jgi:hypothetical protein
MIVRTPLSAIRPHLYRIGAAHRSVVEPVNDHRAGSLGIKVIGSLLSGI